MGIPRLRGPVGTAGEIGVQRPDGRKPEAGEGAEPGSVGVTGNPVAGSGLEKSGDKCERNCTNFGFTSEYVKQAWNGRDFAGGGKGINSGCQQAESGGWSAAR